MSRSTIDHLDAASGGFTGAEQERVRWRARVWRHDAIVHRAVEDLRAIVDAVSPYPVQLVREPRAGVTAEEVWIASAGASMATGTTPEGALARLLGVLFDGSCFPLGRDDLGQTRRVS